MLSQAVATVTIKNDGTTGFVIADAVKFEYLGTTGVATPASPTAQRAASLNRTRLVAVRGTLRIPAGAGGVELYSATGRLLFRASGQGDAATDRLLPVPEGLANQSLVVKYLTR